MNVLARDRENVRIWLEKGLNGEQFVYVETRHARRVFSLDDFVALVKDKLRKRKGPGYIFGRNEKFGFVNIFRG